MAAPLAAFVVIHPVLNMGFNDDFGFYHMALVLARTGRIAYEHWTTPMGLPHAFWGAAIIQVFGFSYFALRVAMLPFWIGSGLLIYLLGGRLGLPPFYSALASLSVTLSPIAIPLGASYHSDITALSFGVGAIYCAVQAAEAPRRSRMSAWLTGGLLMGALAATTRDIYWMLAVWTVLAVLILRWRERNVRTMNVLILVLAIAAALASMWWHYSRPDAPPPPHDPISRQAQGVVSLAEIVAYIGLTAVLVCLPVTITVLRRVLLVKGWPRRIVVLLLGGSCSALLWWPRLFFPPWIGNMFTEYGSFYNQQLMSGLHPVVLRPLVRFALGIVAVVVAAALCGAILQVAAQYRGKVRKAFCEREPLFVFAVVAIPFASAYTAVLVLRNPVFLGYAGYNNLFDRYLLPVMAVGALTAAAVAYRLHPNQGSIAGVAALTLMSAFGIANAHDVFAGERARLDAAQWLVDSGVPRHFVSGGYEYDAWTQLEEKGFMSPERERKLPVILWFLHSTDAVTPCYYVVASPQAVLSTVREVAYDAWLPPRRRTLLVQQSVGDFARNMGCPQATASASK